MHAVAPAHEIGSGTHVVLARPSPSSIWSPIPIGFVVPQAKQW